MSTWFVAIILWTVAAPAQTSDPLHITPAEKAACSADAMRLCSSTYPDENRLLACMSANRASLGPTCLKAFDAGVKRRGF